MALIISSHEPKKYKLERMFFENPERFARQVVPENQFNLHLKEIMKKYNVSKWVELGCGLGVDVANALKCGLDAYGVDGSDLLRDHLLFPKDRYYTGDLTKSLTLSFIDGIGCREVAEHMPFESSLQLVKNIVSNCRVAYFTAAPPGQAGSGHINCRTRNFWIALFDEFGWAIDEEITSIVKEHARSNIDRKSGMVVFGTQRTELR